MRGGAGSAPRRSARAFAPGHLTAVFAPETAARDPRARGSLGAGITLELGARAEARYAPDGPSGLTIRSDVGDPLPISHAVARSLLSRRSGRLEVAIRHELPIGQGFGMSAAGALATGLAVSAVLRLPRTRAVEAAHLADLAGLGGLGGVAAILGGGYETRTRAGIPPWGCIRHRPFPYALFVAVVGSPLASPKLLANGEFLRRVREAAEPGLRALLTQPSPRRLLEEAERFGDRLELSSARVRAALGALRRAGAWSAQAMFGESVYAVPRSSRARAGVTRILQKLGASTVELRAAHGGARVRRGVGRAR